ncbi:MAG: hypothetical protein LBS41_02565 [Streptococcaceae bacterium]|jgi:hypothetical protein|nr:hypothetical protein [Streptococcaceae bacterium]
MGSFPSLARADFLALRDWLELAWWLIRCLARGVFGTVFSISKGLVLLTKTTSAFPAKLKVIELNRQARGFKTLIRVDELGGECDRDKVARFKKAIGSVS